MVTQYKFRNQIWELIYLDRFLIRKEIRTWQTRVYGLLVDVGCGRQPYRGEFKNISKYVGIDRANSEIVHDLTIFPYPMAPGSADWILCSQVIDDFPDPAVFLKELNRLLSQRGTLILSVSFVWELHDLPHDYGRPSHEQLRLLLEGNGFEIIELQHLGNSWITLGQVININLLNIMAGRSWWLKLISPLLLLNSLLFYTIGTLLNYRRFDTLPLAFFLVAQKNN